MDIVRDPYLGPPPFRTTLAALPTYQPERERDAVGASWLAAGAQVVMALAEGAVRAFGERSAPRPACVCPACVCICPYCTAIASEPHWVPAG